MSEWQTIDTAPKHGRPIIGYAPQPANVPGGQEVGETWWQGDKWACFPICQPTHWMPLPEPPGAHNE